MRTFVSDAFGYSVKFVSKDFKVKSCSICRCFVYLDDVFIGIIEHIPSGFVLFSSDAYGPCFYKSTSMISCVRYYILNKLLYDRNSTGLPVENIKN